MLKNIDCNIIDKKSSKYKVCVICVYFGKLPNYFRMWEKSCGYNSWIDFIVVTDQDIEFKYDNLISLKMTLEEFKKLVEKKLEMPVKLSAPYKCCDYKPIYGIAFDDYLKKYDFWGHCDLDVIFGDLRKYLTDSIFSMYDKIYPLGHLTFYRNTKECLDRYKIKCGQYATYDKTFSSDKIFVFDECCGMHQIYVNKNFPYYKAYEMADISPKRFRITFPSEECMREYDVEDKNKFTNYDKQIFYREDGGIYRAYVDNNGVIQTNEYSYIHIKERRLEILEKNDDMEDFFILPNGFSIKKDKGVPLYDEFDIYNVFKGNKIEELEEKKYNRDFKIKKMRKRMSLYIKERK